MTSAGFKAVPSVQLHCAPGAWGRQNDGFNHFLLSFYQTLQCLPFVLFNLESQVELSEFEDFLEQRGF